MGKKTHQRDTKLSIIRDRFIEKQNKPEKKQSG